METTIIAGLNATLNAASLVRDIGNSYYEASAEWEDIPRKVKQLENKSRNWSGLVLDLGLNRCDEVITSLREAQALLEREVEKLAEQKKEAKGKQAAKGKKVAKGKKAGKEEEKEERDEVLEHDEHKRQEKRKIKLGTLFKNTIFPVEIGRSINKAIEAFDNIPKILQDRQDARRLAENESLHRKDSLDFIEDPRYVPLKDTERAVRKSLTQANCKLALLHGSSGQGKSTLARVIALEIQSVKKSRTEIQFTSKGLSQQSASPVASDPPTTRSTVLSERSVSPITSGPSTSISNDPKTLHETFREVVVLECGAEKDVLELQIDLRQKLGWRSPEISKDLTSLLSRDVQTSLKGQLRNRKLLIVLDDVWEPNLVREMLIPARKATNVKFLVTSQDPELCKGLNPVYKCERIPMETVSLSDATKILVHHMFSSDSDDRPGDIPEDIQGCINGIIEMVGGNVLAIACVGAASFNETDFFKVESWEGVKKELLGWLQKEHMAMMHVKPYPKSYESALHFAFQRLQKDERRLLFLILLCRQASVPRPIVEYFYKLMKDIMQCQPFLDAIRTLWVPLFVQKQEERYSVHNLLQEFLTRKFSEEYDVQIQDALSRNSKTIGLDHDERDILSAISKVYFENSDFAKRIAEELKSSALDGMDNDKTIVIACMIEPILLLVVKEVDLKQGWTSEIQCNSRQVFWIYLYQTYLDDKGTEFLLREPLTKRYIVRTLYNILYHDEFGQVKAQMMIPEQLLLPLSEILTEEQIYRDFGKCPQDWESNPLVQVTYVIGILLGLFTKYTNLDDLDRGQDPEFTSLYTLFQETVFQIPNLNNLNQDRNFCACAIRALKKFIEFLVSMPNLSEGIFRCCISLSPIYGIRNICRETVNIRGAMRTLVRAISESQNEEVEASASAGIEDPLGLQRVAIISLGLMLFYGKRDYCREFSDIEGAIGSFVHAMAPSNNEEAQLAASEFLWIIALFGGKDVSMKIYRTPEAIPNLLNALGKKDAPELQGAVCRALTIFPRIGEADFCHEIAGVNNAIQALVDATTTSNHVEVQEVAAGTLWSLVSYGDQGFCEEICNVSDSISNLVVAIGNEYAPDLQLFPKSGSSSISTKLWQGLLPENF